jgi:cytochrome c
MDRRKFLAAAIVLFGFVAGSLWTVAQESPEAAQAQAMVERAVAFFQQNGAGATIEAVNKGGEFREGELYVFMVRLDGLSVANAGDSSNLGKSARELKDADGKFYGQEILDRATPEGVWVEYKRHNPASGKVQPKSSWVRKVDGYIIGCGIYQSE